MKLSKWIFSILIAVLLMVGFLSVSASAAEITASGTCGEDLTWELTDDGTLTISGTGPMANSGQWSEPMYGDRDAIKTVVIEEGVTSIGKYAFYKCTNLSTITIPDSVTLIDEYALAVCTSLTNITIPKGITSICNHVFSGCSSLTNITIPEGVTSIGSYAFAGCSSLTSITIPEGVTCVAYRTFMSCTKLVSVKLPDGISSIEEQAFYGCYALTEIAIPDSVISIGKEAFIVCKSLKSVTFPDELISIGWRAYFNCYNLTSITFSDSIEQIDSRAFYGCSSLSQITFEGQTPPVIQDDTFTKVTATVYYPGTEAWTEAVRQNYGGNLTWEARHAIASASVTLDSVLGVNFTAPADSTVKITVDGTEYPVTYAGGQYTAPVFAQDMTKQIVATLYNADGQSIDTKTFSLETYVTSVNNSDASTEVKALANATLAYCQSAAYLKYGIGTPPALEAIPGDAFAEHVFTAGGSLKGVSIHAYLEEACQLRMRLSADYADCTVLVDGVEAELVQSGDTYLASTAQILPQDYDIFHTFQVVRGEQELYNGSFNVLMYLGCCIDKNIGTADQQNLLQAMYHYYAAAEIV